MEISKLAKTKISQKLKHMEEKDITQALEEIREHYQELYESGTDPELIKKHWSRAKRRRVQARSVLRLFETKSSDELANIVNDIKNGRN